MERLLLYSVKKHLGQIEEIVDWQWLFVILPEDGSMQLTTARVVCHYSTYLSSRVEFNEPASEVRTVYKVLMGIGCRDNGDTWFWEMRRVAKIAKIL